MMPVKIPQALKKILEDKAYGHVVTFNPAGRFERHNVTISLILEYFLQGLRNLDCHRLTPFSCLICLIIFREDTGAKQLSISLGPGSATQFDVRWNPHPPGAGIRA